MYLVYEWRKSIPKENLLAFPGSRMKRIPSPNAIEVPLPEGYSSQFLLSEV